MFIYLFIENTLAKKSKGKRISKQEDAQLRSIVSPSGKDSGSRDVERDLDNLVCATGFSDSGVSFSEVEMQEKKTKVLKKNKKFKKTEKIVGEVVSTEDENDLEDVGKTSEPLKSTKRTESIDKKTSGAKKGKNSVPRKKKEKTTKLITNDEEKNIPNDVCKSTEDDEGKRNDVKKMKPHKTLNNSSRRQKPVRRNISGDSDDDDDDIDNDDDHDDDGNGEGMNISRTRKKYGHKTFPDDTDDEVDVVQNNEDRDDDDDDHIKKISRKTKPVFKRIPGDTDDDDNYDDDGNDDRITEDDDDDSEINDGDDGEENISHKPKEKDNITKQKPKDKYVIRKKVNC